MKNSNIDTEHRTVISGSDAKQGSPKRMNLRVLLGSMVALALIGAILLFVFFQATPAGMDATPTGAEAPASTAPQGAATETTPPPTTPPAATDANPAPEPAPAPASEPAPTPTPAP